MAVGSPVRGRAVLDGCPLAHTLPWCRGGLVPKRCKTLGKIKLLEVPAPVQPIVGVHSVNHHGCSPLPALPLHIQHQQEFFEAGRGGWRAHARTDRVPALAQVETQTGQEQKGTGLSGDQETRSYRSHVPEPPWRAAVSHSNTSRSRTTTGLALLTVTCGTTVGPGQPGAGGISWRQVPGFTPAGQEWGWG